MKLVRFGEVGFEKPGLIDKNGDIRDLSGHIKELNGSMLSEENLTKLGNISIDSLPSLGKNQRLGTPVANTGKLIAIGLNYADHAEETNSPIPTEPIVFMKAISSITGPNDDVIIPKNSKKSDWEVELAFIIGKTTKNVSIDDAMSFVAGYTICNDVSEREWQLEHGSQWSKGKSFDTFAPIGPWLVTKDEINDPHNLAMWLNVNGNSMQSGNTKTMIFNIPEIISYLSSFVTLHPGDVVTTGTPPGVGMGMKPEAIFLKPGDEMHLGIDGLGEQKQKVK